MSTLSNKTRKGKLKEFASFQEGYVNPSQTIPSYFGDEIKWLRAVDLNDSFVFETSRRLSRMGFESAGKSALLFEPGTLAISKSGTIGRLGILKDYMCGNRAVINIRVDQSRCDNLFIFYSLLNSRKRIEQLASGSVQRNLYCSVLGELEIDLPSLSEQKIISQILSSLDNKIELNRQTSKTLEAMARAFFKAWFVNFEPVRANMRNRPSESASLEIAKMFPSEFENDIPIGWEIKKMDDVLLAKGGTTPSTKNSIFWDGENYWATPKDLSNLQFPVLLATERKITDEGVRQIGSGVLPKGTLLFSSRAPIGYLSISQIPVSINQGFIAIQPKKVSNLFMLYWLMENMDVVKSRANGSTFQEISKSSFREIEIILPSENILGQFEKKVAPIFERIVSNEKENAELAEMRDSLLPRLISGKINVERYT